MTKKELQQIVNEQVAIAVRRYVVAYLPIVVNEVVQDIVKKSMNEIIDALPESKSKTPSAPKRTPVNEAYNSTAIPNDDADWETLGGEPLTTMNTPPAVPLDLIMRLASGENVVAPRELTYDGTKESEVIVQAGPSGAPVVAKDYRNFMKAINQKVSERRPGR